MTMKLLMVSAFLLAQVAQACNRNDYSLTNKCLGEECISDSQCALDYCILADINKMRSGICALPVWAIVLIALGSLLVLILLCALCCCCCRRRRNDRISRKLDVHNHYYEKNAGAAGYQQIQPASYQYPNQVPNSGYNQMQ